MTSLALSVALAACAQPTAAPGGTGSVPAGASIAASPGSTAMVAGDDIRFTLTFRFDDRGLGEVLWGEGTFTTTAALPRAFLESLPEGSVDLPMGWPSRGDQRYQDCGPGDEECNPCQGAYTSEWTDTAVVTLLERTGDRLVIELRLAPDPLANDDRFWNGQCEPRLSGAMDAFPPMHMTIAGLSTANPQLAVEVVLDDGSAPIEPGEIFEVALAQLP